MENASQALIIAATILLGIIIVSIAVYTFSLFGGFSRRMEEEREEQQIEAFNAKFNKYSQLHDISPHDIVTVINLAKENNSQNGFVEQEANDGDLYVQVEITNLDTVIGLSAGKNKRHCESWEENDTQSFISYYTTNNADGTTDEIMQRFTCTSVQFGNGSRRVNKIIFEKNT